MKKKLCTSWLVGLVVAPAISFAQCPGTETTVWQNHYVFSAGTGVTTSFLAPGIFGVSAPVGGTLAKILDVPPGFQIKQVIACSTPAASGATVTQFDVSIPLVPVAHGPELPPSCTTFVTADSSLINPQAAPTTLTLDFGANPTIQVTGVGLVLQADPALWSFVPPHEHIYRTGRGRGHNNTSAVTEGLAINGEECGSTVAYPLVTNDDSGDDSHGGKGKHKHKHKGKKGGD